MVLVYPRKIVGLMERDGYECHYCGRTLQLDGPLYPTKDHIVPRHRGGSNRLGNLVLACQDCNSRKGAENWHYHCDRCNAARAWATARRPTGPPSLIHPATVTDEHGYPLKAAFKDDGYVDVEIPIERCHHLSAAAYCLNCAGP